MIIVLNPEWMCITWLCLHKHDNLIIKHESSYQPKVNPKSNFIGLFTSMENGYLNIPIFMQSCIVCADWTLCHVSHCWWVNRKRRNWSSPYSAASAPCPSLHVKAPKNAGSFENDEGQTLGKLSSSGEVSGTSFVGINLAYYASNFTVLCMI